MEFTETSARASQAAPATQRDGSCALCGEPPATTATALVALCERHLSSLAVITNMDVVPRSYFRGTLPG